MREIRTLGINDIDRYAEIAYDAYPSFKELDCESIAKYKDSVKDYMLNDDTVTFYGMFEDENMVSVMRLFDFETNLFGRIVSTSGIGFLGVDLPHKKKKIARDMLSFYENLYREKQTPIGSLLPFRPDFYKKMGYGFGTKINKHTLPCERFPAYYDECNIVKLGREDYDSLDDIHDRFVSKTHGMNKRLYYEKKSLKSTPENKVYASLDKDNNIIGYMVIEFINGKSDNYTINNMYIHELVYDSPKVLRQLLGFVRKQEDQVNMVTVVTCDEDIYHMFNDPRNNTLNYIPFGYLETNTQGVGMMYKVFDVAEVFKQCDYRDYNGMSIKVEFIVDDSFRDSKPQRVGVCFKEGRASITEEVNDIDLKVTMNISEFSSLFMGVVSPSSLYGLGLLELSEEDMLHTLDMLFYIPKKPQTNTDF